MRKTENYIFLISDFRWIQKITEAAEKANYLSKIQQKPLPSIPNTTPPPALEETPESKILESQSENQNGIPPEKSSEDSRDSDENELTTTQDYDPNAITTTQPCQLIQPAEIVVSSQNVQKATLILTPQETLRRHSEIIQKSINEMGRIVCEINHVPPEDFSIIADIASQPETSSDLSELCLAAFSQSKQLFEVMSNELVVSENEDCPSQFGMQALCDNCAKFSDIPSDTNINTPALNLENEDDCENDNLYCEIETLDKAANENGNDHSSKNASHIEINENYSTSNEQKKYPAIRIDKIASSVNTLHSLVSKLTVRF